MKKRIRAHLLWEMQNRIDGLLTSSSSSYTAPRCPLPRAGKASGKDLTMFAAQIHSIAAEMFVPDPGAQVHSMSSHRSLPQLKKDRHWAAKQNMHVQNSPSNVGSWYATQQVHITMHMTIKPTPTAMMPIAFPALHMESKYASVSSPSQYTQSL